MERLVWNESRGNPYVGMNKSNYSAGIAQISRLIWKTYSKIPYDQAKNPALYEYNIEVAARFLKHNYNRYHSWKLALVAYNEGETITNQIIKNKRSLSPITQKYVANFKEN